MFRCWGETWVESGISVKCMALCYICGWWWNCLIASLAFVLEWEDGRCLAVYCMLDHTDTYIPTLIPLHKLQIYLIYNLLIKKANVVFSRVDKAIATRRLYPDSHLNSSGHFAGFVSAQHHNFNHLGRRRAARRSCYCCSLE